MTKLLFLVAVLITLLIISLNLNTFASQHMHIPKSSDKTVSKTPTAPPQPTTLPNPSTTTTSPNQNCHLTGGSTCVSPPPQPTTLPSQTSTCIHNGQCGTSLLQKKVIPPTSSTTKKPTNSSDNNGCPAGYYRPYPGLGNYYACQKNPPSLPRCDNGDYLVNGKCSMYPCPDTYALDAAGVCTSLNVTPQPGTGPIICPPGGFINANCVANPAPMSGSGVLSQSNSSKTLPVNPQIGIVGGLIK